MLWFNLIFGLNFLKPVYLFQTSLFFFKPLQVLNWGAGMAQC